VGLGRELTRIGDQSEDVLLLIERILDQHRFWPTRISPD
jgi:hypothetical protein